MICLCFEFWMILARTVIFSVKPWGSVLTSSEHCRLRRTMQEKRISTRWQTTDPICSECFRNVSACCNLTDINFHMWGRKLAFKTVLPGLRIKLPWIGNFVDTNEKIGCAITKRLPGPPDSPSKVKLSPTSMTTRSAVRTKAALAEMAAWHLKEWCRYLGSLELNEAG